MPIYLIEIDNKQADRRLVEAKNEAAARKHVAESILKADAIRSADQIKAMAALAAGGTKVETAAEAE